MSPFIFLYNDILSYTTIQLIDMNGTALKRYSFLIGVVIYRRTNRSWLFKGKVTIRTPPVFKSYCRIPGFSAGDHALARGQSPLLSFGLSPFMLTALYLPHCFIGIKWRRLPVFIGFSETTTSRVSLRSSSSNFFHANWLSLSSST